MPRGGVAIEVHQVIVIIESSPRDEEDLPLVPQSPSRSDRTRHLLGLSTEIGVGKVRVQRNAFRRRVVFDGSVHCVSMSSRVSPLKQVGVRGRKCAFVFGKDAIESVVANTIETAASKRIAVHCLGTVAIVDHIRDDCSRLSE